MGIAGEHMHRLDVVAINLPLQHFAFGIVEVALLNQSMPFHYNELLELGVVPVLAFGDARLGDVNAHLTCIEGVYQLGEATTVIHIHLQVKGGLLVRQITEVGAVELLGKAASRYLRNHQRLGLFGELLKQINNTTKGNLMSNRYVAIAAYLF